MKKLVLLITTFIAGGSIMVVEMLGSRVMAPYYGSSVYIWAILIGVVLMSLSIGYYVGGKYADRNPSYTTVVKLLLTGSFAVAFLACIKDSVLLVTSLNSPLPIYVQATIDAIVLFVPSTLILGMISPLLARLSLIDVEHSGSTIGLLYACNTIGSIVGTFLGGIVLVSYFGVTAILVSVAILLAVLAISLMLIKKIPLFTIKKSLVYLAIIAAVVIALQTQGLKALYPNLVSDRETHYGRLWAFDRQITDTEFVRVLTNTVHAYQSGMYLSHPDLLLFPYTQYLDLYSQFNAKAKKVLLIGGGAFSYPKYFSKNHTDKLLHVVEIDPAMKEMAVDFFEYIETPNIQSFTEDGRTFVTKRDDMYDAILVDAFLSNATIPFHLTTSEFVRELHSSLSDDGIVIVNMLSSIKKDESTFLSAEYKTYKQYFPEVFVIKVNPGPEDKRQNYIMIASKKNLENKNEVLNPMVVQHTSAFYPSIDTTNAFVLTDDFAPIERYVE